MGHVTAILGMTCIVGLLASGCAQTPVDQTEDQNPASGCDTAEVLVTPILQTLGSDQLAPVRSKMALAGVPASWPAMSITQIKQLPQSLNGIETQLPPELSASSRGQFVMTTWSETTGLLDSLVASNLPVDFVAQRLERAYWPAAELRLVSVPRTGSTGSRVQASDHDVVAINRDGEIQWRRHLRVSDTSFGFSDALESQAIASLNDTLVIFARPWSEGSYALANESGAALGSWQVLAGVGSPIEDRLWMAINENGELESSRVLRFAGDVIAAWQDGNVMRVLATLTDGSVTLDTGEMLPAVGTAVFMFQLSEQLQSSGLTVLSERDTQNWQPWWHDQAGARAFTLTADVNVPPGETITIGGRSAVLGESGAMLAQISRQGQVEVLTPIDPGNMGSTLALREALIQSHGGVEANGVALLVAGFGGTDDLPEIGGEPLVDPSELSDEFLTALSLGRLDGSGTWQGSDLIRSNDALAISSVHHMPDGSLAIQALWGSEPPSQDSATELALQLNELPVERVDTREMAGVTVRWCPGWNSP